MNSMHTIVTNLHFSRYKPLFFYIMMICPKFILQLKFRHVQFIDELILKSNLFYVCKFVHLFIYVYILGLMFQFNGIVNNGFIHKVSLFLYI